MKNIKKAFRQLDAFPLPDKEKILSFCEPGEEVTRKSQRAFAAQLIPLCAALVLIIGGFGAYIALGGSNPAAPETPETQSPSQSYSEPPADDTPAMPEPAVKVVIEPYDGGGDDMIEIIYEDDEYEYWFGSAISAHIMLTFENGERVSLKEALEQEKISMEDLLLNGLQVYVTPKNTRPMTLDDLRTLRALIEKGEPLTMEHLSRFDNAEHNVYYPTRSDYAFTIEVNEAGSEIGRLIIDKPFRVGGDYFHEPLNDARFLKKYVRNPIDFFTDDLEAYLALPPEDDRASLTYPAVWDYENPTEIPTDAVYEISPDGKYAASTCNGENNYDADGYYYPFYTAVIIRLDDKVITDVYDFGAEVNIEKFVWSPDSDGAFILCLGHKDNDSFVLLSAGEIKGGLVETQPLKEYANRLSAQEDFADKLTLRIAPIEWTKGEDGGYWEILCEFNFADDNGIPVSGGQFVLDARSHKPV